LSEHYNHAGNLFPQSKPMRPTAVIRSKRQTTAATDAYKAIYDLEGSLREFPLEADLEEERRAERKRENER